MFKEYTQYDGVALAELIRNKEVAPDEVLEAAITRIEETNTKINAVVYKMYEHARREVKKIHKDRIFAGVPFAIKDLGIDYKETPTTGGSFLTKNAIASEDSELMKRYRQLGLITLGKTNVPEFGIMGITEPRLWGPCRNPWDLSRTPGGSSGGSAAAVAAGLVPIASADDGGGSIRIPASACGIFGFKPSRGVQPMGPKRGEGWLGLVAGHVVTKSVRDSAMVLDSTRGADLASPYGTTASIQSCYQAMHQSVKGMKVAFSKNSLFGEQTDQSCLDALAATMSLCESLGMVIVEDCPLFDKEEFALSYYTIIAACTAGEVARYERQMGHKADLNTVEYPTWFLKVAGEKLRADQLEQAIFVMRQASYLWEKFLAKYDFFCTPTMAYPPSPIGLMEMNFLEKAAVQLSDYLPTATVLSILRNIATRGMEKTPNTAIFNMSGHPAMSVPTFWTPDNIPIGVQFVGRMANDHSLFQLASALETACSWQKKQPSL